ncbi:hypothetical protein MSMTP_0925 [Methanosarcina sp. MTP4]|uniref:hypothetical protein n=1 Tax=Methanosarcina sp. MTP4 TaxID=1434100 RepID=UPI000615892B|nr:hypothetical protein [Methanosarcina sp. MTP4]AKB24394.1 hypothetical protein MSMTP_0925 [Methanosarcina sp. MTP4]
MKRIIFGLIVLLVILFSANCVVANNWNSAGDSGRNDRDQGVEESSFMQMTLPAVPVSSSTYADNMALNSHYIILESVEYPIIQINVKLGDKEGKEAVRQYEYTARVYNSSQEQVGEDIVLRLNGNPDHSLSTLAHGTASLPSDLPEGNYYVFVYQNNTTSEFILPFMCKNNGKLETCCNSSSITGLISEGILVQNCSKFWCCGCGCTKQQVKNSIYIKNDGTGEEPGEEDKPTYVYDMVIPARHNISESTQYLINVTLGDDNGRNDTKKYTYVAKVLNSSQKQVGENIDLTLTNPFDDENTDPTSYIEAQGMASLPVDTPEGNYYLFVYQNNTINESILPFFYNSSENLAPCCNEISCVTSLIRGEDIISDNCSESWCCGCNCTDNDVKNRIYIENEGAEHDGDDGSYDDTEAPAILSVALNDSTPTTGEPIKVSVNAADNVKVINVEASGTPLEFVSGDLWEGSITAVEGAHFLNVSAVDGTGNKAWDNSTSYTATTPDTEAPNINTVTLNNTNPVTGEYIQITVNVTDNIGVTSVKADSRALTRQNDTIWEGNITSVEGTHYVNVSAIDDAGNVAWDNSTSYTAKTPDTEAPEISSVILDDYTPNTGDLITVSVEATDNFGVTVVEASGVPLAFVSGNLWKGNITVVEGIHSVNVSVVDAVGNIAWDNSTSYTATTPDTEAPVIISVLLSDYTPDTGDLITVSVEATDNFGVTGVKGSSTPLAFVSGNFWEGNITVVEGIHSVNVSVVDAAGNIAWDNSTSYTATTPGTDVGADDEEGKESIDDGENNVDDGDKPSKRRSSADRGTLPIRKKETTESFSLPPETRIAASNPGLSINALADDGHQKEEIKDSNGFDWLILWFLAAMFGLFLAICGSIFSRYSKLQKE